MTWASVIPGHGKAQGNPQLFKCMYPLRGRHGHRAGRADAKKLRVEEVGVILMNNLAIAISLLLLKIEICETDGSQS